MASLAAHRHQGVLDSGDLRNGGWARSSLPLQSSSPTLARVHRANMRLEGLLPPASQRGSYVPHEESSWTHLDSSTTSPLTKGVPDVPASPGAALKRGILLTLRQGTLFRRWKERYFLLTKDCISCFKVISSGPTSMGPFIFKVRLAEVRNVTWTNSRSDAMGTVTLELGPPLSPSYDETSPPCLGYTESGPARPTTIQLRASPGVKDAILEDWFELIEESVESSKSRRAARTASIGKRTRQ